MRLLLDTHALVWWMKSNKHLTPVAYEAVTSRNNEVFTSVACAWEMAIKVGLGKWPEASSVLETFEADLTAVGVRILPISVTHARTAGLMSSPHRDPFDRLLAAQAITEGLTLVTSDAKMASLGAPCLW